MTQALGDFSGILGMLGLFSGILGMLGLFGSIVVAGGTGIHLLTYGRHPAPQAVFCLACIAGCVSVFLLIAGISLHGDGH